MPTSTRWRLRLALPGNVLRCERSTPPCGRLERPFHFVRFQPRTCPLRLILSTVRTLRARPVDGAQAFRHDALELQVEGSPEEPLALAFNRAQDQQLV